MVAHSQEALKRRGRSAIATPCERRALLAPRHHFMRFLQVSSM